MKLTIRNIFHYYIIDCVQAIEKASILEPDGLIPYETTAYNAVRRTVAKQEKKTLKKINKIIDGVNPESETSIKTGVKKIENEVTKYGVKIAPASSDTVYKHSEKVYKDAKRATSSKFDTAYTFAEPDRVAIDRVNTFGDVFVGEHYKDDVTESVTRTIRNIISESEALDSTAIANKIKKAMPGVMKQEGWWNVLVSQLLNHSRSYSSMQFYTESKIDKYEVVALLDSRTSQTCRYMDGTILEVSRTIERWKLYDDAKTTDDVKAVNPWITDKGGILSVGGTTLTPDLTGEDLQALGVNSPPFHANCRTTVVPIV